MVPDGAEVCTEAMTQLSAREYLRVSRDVNHTGRSPDQQHKDNVRALTAQGWQMHPAVPYRDADRSASRYAKKEREDFKRLIADLEANEFDADILAIWESSRGSRRVGEWVDLVDLCRTRNVRIWVTTHNRLYDPANARDRRSLLEDAVDAEYESDKTSERRRRSARASAEAGRPHGRNIYGYLRVYDELTRELLRVEPHPDQAPVVVEAARRALEGESFYGIAKDFNIRRVPTRGSKRPPPTEGEAWTPSIVRQMLRVPAYAGKRDYKGVIVGNGMWDALISFEDWQQLQLIMGAPSRKGPRDHTAKHLLSNIAECGVCRGPLRSWRSRYVDRHAPESSSDDQPPLYYFCRGTPGRPRGTDTRGWHASIRASFLEGTLLDQMFERMSHPELFSIPDSFDHESQMRRAALLTTIAENEEYLDLVKEEAAATRRFDLLVDQESRVQPVINAARRALETSLPVDPNVEILLRSGDREETWKSFDIVQQRRIVRRVVTPVVHRVAAGRKGSREASANRIELIWN
jgi:site-specific DNA recombinase